MDLTGSKIVVSERAKQIHHDIRERESETERKIERERGGGGKEGGKEREEIMTMLICFVSVFFDTILEQETENCFNRVIYLSSVD